MAIKDLIPSNNRNREISTRRGNHVHPFLALHREMNRMFDDVFRGFRFGAVRKLPRQRRPRLAEH